MKLIRATSLIVLAMPGGAAAAETDAVRAPTALERTLQEAYLDRQLVLRTDVKVQEIKSRRVVASTFPAPAPLDRTRPVTVVTSEGVFYLSDYARKEQLETDVRPGLSVERGRTPSDDPRGSTSGPVGDVVEISGETHVILRAGDLIRVTGVMETPKGFDVTLQGFDAGPVQVVVRAGGDVHRSGAERADAFSRALGHLVYQVHESAEERAAAIDPGWPQAIRAAIDQGRVLEGMNELQVLLAWGTPVYITRVEQPPGRVWTFQRGDTLMEQLRNKTRVHFAAGLVVQIEEERR